MKVTQSLPESSSSESSIKLFSCKLSDYDSQISISESNGNVSVFCLFLGVIFLGLYLPIGNLVCFFGGIAKN